MRVEHVGIGYAPVSVYLPTDAETDRYQRMRDDYARRCRSLPLNRYNIALAVCAQGFGIPVSVLQLPRDQRMPRLIEDRLKLMAFCRVVSFATPGKVNSWNEIARLFHRRHPTIINATRKYGAQIAAALEAR